MSKREKRIVEDRLEKYRQKNIKEQVDIITEKISEEENSIHVINTCFQPFESSNESQFVFFRTDPLYLSQSTNFDIALSSTGFNTICLIECKSSLGRGLVSTVKELQKKIDFIEKNNTVSLGENKLETKEYFARKLNMRSPNFYYVLASEIVDLRVSLDQSSIYDDIVQVSEYPFDIWQCTHVYRGTKITRIPIPSKHERDRKISIRDLTDYLNKVHSSAGDTIQICLSSNSHYLAVQSCINLKSFESFQFDDFLSSFSIDLKDYEEFERRYLFQHFIDLGRECSFVKILEDTKDILASSYTIVNRRKKPKQLQENIITKIANRKVASDPEIVDSIKEEKENIIQDIFYKKEPRQKRLTEFTDQQ